jgi:hypothetical protein
MFYHQIKSLCISHPDYGNQKDLLVKYLICDCSNNDEKKMVVSFFGTDSIYDSYAESDTYFSENSEDNASLKNRILKRSESIPLDYFLEKLKQGFKLIFTGHLLGASLAALVTTRLLLIAANFKQGWEKQILFIGFGSALIADEEFKKKIIEKSLTKYFHFIRDENDNFVEFLSISLKLFDCNKKIFNKNLMSELLKAILSKNSSRVESESLNLVNAFLAMDKGIDLNYSIYGHFGIAFKLRWSGIG